MQVGFAQLFAEFDTGRKGYLNRAELGGLVKRVMPEATPAQLSFFAVRPGWAGGGLLCGRDCA